VYETAKETLMYRTVLWTLWERERVGRFGRMTLKHVKYHVRNEKKNNQSLFLLLLYAVVLNKGCLVDSDCSHEIKRCLLLGEKAMTHLDSILKGRDFILLIKVHLVKAVVFPVVMRVGP